MMIMIELDTTVLWYSPNHYDMVFTELFSLSVAGGTTCTRLSSPSNGAVTFSSSFLSSGTIATYTCDLGYSLVGSSSRVCLAFGSWNGSQPYCQRQGVWDVICRGFPYVLLAHVMHIVRRFTSILDI